LPLLLCRDVLRGSIINNGGLFFGEVDHPICIVDKVEERLLVGERLKPLSALAPLLDYVRREPIHNKPPTDHDQTNDVSRAQALVLRDEGECEGLEEDKSERRVIMGGGRVTVIPHCREGP
jgi:hypothetical protein